MYFWTTVKKVMLWITKRAKQLYILGIRCVLMFMMTVMQQGY